MEEIYRRYTDNYKRVAVAGGSYEVSRQDLQRVLGLLFSLADENGRIDDEELDAFFRRLLKTFMGLGDAEPLPEVKPVKLVPVE